MKAQKTERAVRWKFDAARVLPWRIPTQMRGAGSALEHSSFSPTKTALLRPIPLGKLLYAC